MKAIIDEKTLTKEQRRAKLHILRGKNVFLTGSAGSGKSALLQFIIRELEKQGKSVVICAPTGIAALNVGGITIHHAFGFPAECAINTGKGSRGMSIRTRTSGIVKKADTIIIDEISMVRVDLFDAMMASIAKIEDKQKRHIQVIIVGDFFQLPPVIQEGSPDKIIISNFYKRDIGYGYAFEGTYWNRAKFFPIILKEIVRQEDTLFAEALNQLRTGDAKCLSYFNTHCYIGNQQSIHLCAYNYRVDEENQRAINNLSGETYTAKTTIQYMNGYNSLNLDQWVLKSIPDDLVLKAGARVILTVNDDGFMFDEIAHKFNPRRKRNEPKYVNGTQAIFCELSQNEDGKSSAFVMTEDKRIIEIEAITYPIYDFVVKDNGDIERIMVAQYTQLPMKLAYAMTIHRSQGQTYESANIDPQTFSPGQLYVALSRVKNINGISLKRKLRESDLIVDEKVVSFYSNLQQIAENNKGRKMGRPTISENGEKRNCLIWVPQALEKHIRNEINQGRPLPIKNIKIPKDMSKRVHIRVPESLYNHTKQEIKDWKKEIRQMKSKDN